MEKRRWGMSTAEWARARVRLEELLADAASTRSTVTYAEAAFRAFEGRFSARSSALMDLLGEIDTDWAASQGVMIATLVVRKDTGRPGEGYFAFVEAELGEPVENRESFWSEQAESVWKAFGGRQ